MHLETPVGPGHPAAAMRRPRSSWRAACVGAVLCALPWSSLALTGEPAQQEPEVWTPALAAWGARVAPATAAGGADAPALGLSSASRAAVPALSGVGQGSTGAIADPSVTGTLRTPELAPVDESERWVPAFAFHSGILGQNADASVDSASTVTYDYILRATNGSAPAFTVTPPQVQRVTRSLRENKSNTVGFIQTARFPPPPDSRGLIFVPNSGQVVTGGSPVTGPFPRLPVVTIAQPPILPAQGSTTFLTPVVGASLELMSPGLQDLGGRPRLFAHAGASTAFSFDRNTAKEGIPGEVEYPAPAARVGEGEIKGIGSKTSGEVQTLVLSAGLGTAFTLDAFERRLRIKPSVEWMRQQIKVSGRMVRVYRNDTGTNGNSPSDTHPAASFFLDEPIDIQASDTRPFHGIGPGLEVEMDAGRAGPVVLSVFVAGQAYYMLGDRKVHLTGSDTITDPSMVPNTQTVSADFDFNIHQWSYQGGLGLRFRWVPED
jgi:hypothetical protein